MPSHPLNSDHRPDPDVLLARAKKSDEARLRGKLRVYFGSSAGVGKTYAMLQAGRRLAREGRDVVVGIVETHGRRETLAVLHGEEDGDRPLDIVPRRKAGDGGATLEEFDLDATLARKPGLVLVDELAHSNVAGSRHPKRWQDVEELLAAGIDVFTTVNVQHLESLNDIVGGITGIRVWETVPDTFFDSADEVILVDISADELLKRLAAGKVYLPEQAAHAARNFFRKGNLIALREIALRRTADRVGDDVQAYRGERSIERVWGTEAALLCCVGPDPGAERVVRAAARLANQLDVAWHAIYVETPRLQRLPDAQRERILRTVSLAQQLGASTAIVSGGNVADALARYAREQNLSRLVLGRSGSTGVRRFLRAPSLADSIPLRAPELDLVVVGRSAEGEAPVDEPAVRVVAAAGAPDARADEPTGGEAIAPYAYAALACAVVTGAALPAGGSLHPTNIAMLYLLAVTLIAMRFGRGPAVFASFTAVGAFDFFFVDPRFSFAVSDVQYIVTFCVMLTVALVIGTLAANLRYQARVAARREDRARALYEIARELSKALRSDDVVDEARVAIGRLFDAEVHLVLARAARGEPAGGVERLAIDESAARSSGFEPAIAQWAFEHAVPAGAGTDTLAGSPWLFLPLQTSMRVRGVLAIRPSQRRLLMIPEQRRLIETVAALVAIAIERVHYVEVAQDAVVGIQSERLRNSILSALSHDLRTPLATLAGLAETLERRDGHPAVDETTTESLIKAMRDEIGRMTMLVENLLDMARIESGDVRLNLQWHSIEETIGTAIAATSRLLARHRVTTGVPRGLPLVRYDALLLERVLINLLQNAAKYTPADSQVRVAATAEPSALRVTVEDDGPGFPPGYDTPERIERLFDKFARGADESSKTGVGLGLAICRAIVEAHGGTIAAEPAGRVGVRFVVTLPRAEAPAIDGEPVVPADDEALA